MFFGGLISGLLNFANRMYHDARAWTAATAAASFADDLLMADFRGTGPLMGAGGVADDVLEGILDVGRRVLPIDLLGRATIVKSTGSNARIYHMRGGIDRAIDDFAGLTAEQVTRASLEAGSVARGFLEDGSTVSLRAFSSEASGNLPTIQINQVEQADRIKEIVMKFRYE